MSNPIENKAYLALHDVMVSSVVGPVLRNGAWSPPEPFSGLKVSQGGWGNLGSGVLSFSDIIGRDIALLPVNFSQPPLCIACDIFKLKDPESLIG